MPLQPEDLDFTLCILCQSDTGDDLVDPRSKKGDNQNPFDSISEVISGWTLALNEYPYNHDLQKLINHPGGLAQFLAANNCVYHKECRSKINKQKLERAQKKEQKRASENEVSTFSPKKKTRSSEGQSRSCSSSNVSPQAPKVKYTSCFLCDKPPGNEGLNIASTFGLDARVRSCASILRDDDLLRKLSAGDMIAIDAAYHHSCLTKLYNKAKLRESANIKQQPNIEGILHAQAFSDLVEYIEDLRDYKHKISFSEIRSLYKSSYINKY